MACNNDRLSNYGEWKLTEGFPMNNNTSRVFNENVDIFWTKNLIFDFFSDLQTSGVAYPCTGTIISRRVVITAAHCALAKAEGHRL